MEGRPTMGAERGTATSPGPSCIPPAQLQSPSPGPGPLGPATLSYWLRGWPRGPGLTNQGSHALATVTGSWMGTRLGLSPMTVFWNKVNWKVNPGLPGVLRAPGGELKQRQAGLRGAAREPDVSI